MRQADLAAERYARALFMVAERRGEIFEALEDLKRLLALVARGPAPGRATCARRWCRSSASARCCRSALASRVLAPVASFMDLLLRKKRMGLFPAAVDEYEKQVRAWQGLQEAEVVSAVPLTEDEVEAPARPARAA